MPKPATSTAQTELEMVTSEQRNYSLSGAPPCRDTTQHGRQGGMLDFEWGITSERERRPSGHAWHAELVRFAASGFGIEPFRACEGLSSSSFRQVA